jgi:hypothetical protein
VSLMIAAGVNAKTLSEYTGHKSITMTIDRYGHLFPCLRVGCHIRFTRHMLEDWLAEQAKL